MSAKHSVISCDFKFWCQTDSDAFEKYLSHLPVNNRDKSIIRFPFSLKPNTNSAINENAVREEMWRTVTSKDDSLTRVLMHFVYKEETYIANVILRDFRNQSDWIMFFLSILYEMCVLTLSALWWLSKLKIMACHILINDWLDFRVVKKNVKIYPMVVLKIVSNFVLRVFLRSVYIEQHTVSDAYFSCL